MSEHYFWPCESLNGAWETGSHLRARGGCHVSTLFLGRGVTILLVSERRSVNDLIVLSPVDMGIFMCLAIVV